MLGVQQIPEEITKFRFQPQSVSMTENIFLLLTHNSISERLRGKYPALEEMEELPINIFLVITKEGILLLEIQHLAGEMLQKVQSCPGITAPQVYRINHKQVLARQNLLPAALMALEFSCTRFSGTSASITCRFLLAT